MYNEKSFQIALVISVLTHSVVLMGLPRVSFMPRMRPMENVTITYYEIKEIPKPKEVITKKAEPIATKLPEIKKEEILKPPIPARAGKEPAAVKPKGITAVKKIEEKKFEKIIEEEEDSAKKATYISYYRAVRESIKQHADRNFLRKRSLKEGEVFLSFLVTSSGELLQVKVVDSRSVNDAMLRNIAIDSIRDASPFPPFPRGMSQYQITFNIIISFELNR